MKFSKFTKRVSSLMLAVALILSLTIPALAASPGTDSTNTVKLLAAASTRYSLGERVGTEYPVGTLLRNFEDGTGFKVDVTYDSSGNLLNLMRNNPNIADIFISADLGRMDTAISESLIAGSTKYELLGNKLVLIGNKTSGPAALTYAGLQTWLQTVSVPAKPFAAGDPLVVPAGTYTKQVLGDTVWNAISSKTELYSNVTNVLNAVADNVKPIGSVYETDAATEKASVNVLDTKDIGIIYPIGITQAAVTAGSDRLSEAEDLVDFLIEDIDKTDGSSIFQDFGFSKP